MTRLLKAPLVVLVVFIFLSGCAKHYSTSKGLDPYGFFSGVWHGMIFHIAACLCFFSWILSLFGAEVLDSVQIIGRPNTGFTYYFGFAIALTHLRLFK
jgi:hypothetical protein